MPKHLNDEYEMVEVGRLTPHPANVNEGDWGAIQQSIEANGFFGSLVVQRSTRNILAGNHRFAVAKSLGYDRLPVTWVDVDDDAALRILLADNRTGRLGNDNPNALAELLTELAGTDRGLAGTGFDGDDLDTLLSDLANAGDPFADPAGAGNENAPVEPEQARRTLAERFGVPPFSVLDARQGYWQERKRAWLSLGIQSELGRGENLTEMSESNDLYRYSQNEYLARIGRGPLAEKKGALDVSETVHRLKPSADQARKHSLARCYGQDLMRGEHIVGEPSRSFIDEGATRRGNLWHGGASESTRKVAAATPQSGTSIFDPVLCELAYRWFCPTGGSVLDPFAGGSVRGVVASRLGLDYTGIELRAEQVAANEEQARTLCPEAAPRWIVGDGRDAVSLLDAGGECPKVDFVFSCPPYADLEVYSDDPADLSTMPYPAFLEAYKAIVAAALSLLRPNRFACFVVGDVRDRKGFYRNFVGDTVNAFQEAGATLYNEAVLVTAVGSLPIRVGKQFGSYRKLGKTHQNVLVFYKGDPARIPEVLGEVEYDAALFDSDEGDQAYQEQ